MRLFVLFLVFFCLILQASDLEKAISEYRQLFLEQGTVCCDGTAASLSQQQDHIISLILSEDSIYDDFKDYTSGKNASTIGFMEPLLSGLLVRLVTEDDAGSEEKADFVREALERIRKNRSFHRHLLSDEEQERYVNMVAAVYNLASARHLPVHRGKDATEYFSELAGVWARMSPDFKGRIIDLLKQGSYREQEEPQLFTLTTECFVIHYTRRGRNAVAEPDRLEPGPDGNEHPAYVIRVWESFEKARSIEVKALKMKPPHKHYNVWIKDLGEGLYGATVPDFSLPGDEKYYKTFIDFENDFSGKYCDNDMEDMVLGRVMVTAAHEYFHACQAMYGGLKYGVSLWLAESTAVWAEDHVFNQVNDYVHYLRDGRTPFHSPHLTLTRFTYSGCIFMKFLSEKYGPSKIRQIWEGVESEKQALPALKKALGPAMNADFGGYVSALLLKDERFLEGSAYPELKMTATFSHYDLVKHFQYSTPQYLGANYICLEPEGVSDMDITFSSVKVLPVRLIRYYRSGITDEEYKAGGNWSVTVNKFGHNVVKLVIAPYCLDPDSADRDFLIKAEKSSN